MTDYYEIDFLGVETDKSGDAITLRYRANGYEALHVVDGGFQETGKPLVAHLVQHYGDAAAIDRVVLTHPDGDHAGGLREVLERLPVRELWMLRPWIYASELLPRFANYTSVERLAARLRSIYTSTAALEEIAERKRIPIYEPFQGARIGAFTVLAPSRARYLDLIVTSEKTPEAIGESSDLGSLLHEMLLKAANLVEYFKAGWGFEAFSAEETSAENDMSIVQVAQIAGHKIVLTGDAGRGALSEAAAYAPAAGFQLPGATRFQVPHHGSRRNVSTEILDVWLGPRLNPRPTEATFTAICSSAKADKDHPRKAVIRAFIHRGANFFATEGNTVRVIGGPAPNRGWGPLQADPYPDQIER